MDGYNRPHSSSKGDEIQTDGDVGCCGYILMFFSVCILILFFPFSLLCSLKVVQEYERAVIFRLGRVVSGGAKGPGLFLLLPCVDSFRSVDLRTFSYDIPPQEILSKDSVTVAVDAVIYARIFDATLSIINVENAHGSTKLLAATTLRNVLGTKALQEILSDREHIAQTMKILSRDSVTVAVDAVIYARIFDATLSIINVENAHGSTKLLAATTLRNVLGTKILQEILSDRESIAQTMQIISKDSVTIAVDAVVYARVFDPNRSSLYVANAQASTRLLAASTLRKILGRKTLHEILSERGAIARKMKLSLDEATDPWGVKVERVEVKDVRLPVQMQRAMAAEAESTREARAKVIAAEGEMKASRSLKEAADVMMESPAAIQLRYLQTLNTIAAEKNSTIIFPLPIDLISSLKK